MNRRDAPAAIPMAARRAYAIVDETDADGALQIIWHWSCDDQLRKLLVTHPEKDSRCTKFCQIAS
jgi:hypothetical protein